MIGFPPNLSRQKRHRRLAAFLWKWAAAVILFGWLYAKLQLQPWIAAAIIGVAVTWTAYVLSQRARLFYPLDWPSLAVLLRRLPGKVLHDVVLLPILLWQSLTRRQRYSGSFRMADIASSGLDAASPVHRALLFGAVSLPPNSFAVSLANEDSLVIHRLAAASGKEEPLL